MRIRALVRGNRKYYLLTALAGLGSPFAYHYYSSNKDRSPGSSHYPYVLVGGGTASYFAAQTIRARDQNAKVLIIGEENETPYNRSKLSKVLSPEQLERVPYEVDTFYPTLVDLANMEHGGISLMRNIHVARIDPTRRVVVLGSGESIGYDKCLLATGSRPKPVEMGDPESKNSVDRAHRAGKLLTDFRTIQDFKSLESLLNANPTQRVAIVGGGLLACELAHSLRSRKSHADTADAPYATRYKRPSVTQILAEPHVLKPIVPKRIASDVEKELAVAGVELLPNTRICSIRYAPHFLNDDKVELVVESAGQEPSKGGMPAATKRLSFDHVIVDTGVVPRAEVAVVSGFKIDQGSGGVLADSGMCVTDGVWAAGDVCSFLDPQLERRRHMIGWEHAQTTGRIAGENMTNGNREYTHQAAFQTILGDRTFLTGVGDVNAQAHRSITLQPEQDSSDEKQAVTLYVDRSNNRVVGALLYNVFGSSLDVARKLIADKATVKDPIEAARLFELWDRTTETGGDKGNVNESKEN